MTASAVIPPAAVLIVGGLILPLLHQRLRQLALLLLPLVTLYLVWQVPDGVALEGRFLGYTLALVKGDALSRPAQRILGLVVAGNRGVQSEGAEASVLVTGVQVGGIRGLGRDCT